MSVRETYPGGLNLDPSRGGLFSKTNILEAVCTHPEPRDQARQNHAYPFIWGQGKKVLIPMRVV